MTTLPAPRFAEHEIGLYSAGILMSPEEFDSIDDYDEAYRCELVHGVLIVHSIPSEAEAGPNDLLGFLFRLYQSQHAEGGILDETLPERYIRTPDSRRRADRIVWCGLGRVPNSFEDVPAIVIEFVSIGRRNRQPDYVEKRSEYLALGVKEYWIVDRFKRQMTVYRPATADGPSEEVIHEQGIFRTPLLPGFELPLARLLESADKWER